MGAAGEIKRRGEAKSDFGDTVESCCTSRDRSWSPDHFKRVSSYSDNEEFLPGLVSGRTLDCFFKISRDSANNVRTQ